MKQSMSKFFLIIHSHATILVRKKGKFTVTVPDVEKFPLVLFLNRVGLKILVLLPNDY